MQCFAQLGLWGGGSTAPSTAPSFTAGTAQTARRTYTITADGTTATLVGAPAVAGDGFVGWFGDAGQSHKGYMYESGSVRAIAVMDRTTDAPISGISGVPSTTVPLAGSATYNGGFSMTYLRGGAINAPWNARGAFNTTVDFGAGTVAGSGTGSTVSSLSITGTLAGSQFTGTAQISALEYSGAATAPLSGGFFGTNTLAGVYQGDTATGVIWGVTP